MVRRALISVCLLPSIAVAAAPPAAAHAAGAPPARTSIVGGSDASPGSWPSAAFVSADTGDGRSVACSGTVVAPGAVLTAAHCVADATGAPRPPAAFAVVTGRRDLAGSGGQIHAVARVLVHPAYEAARARADAALLVLATATTAPPIALAGAADGALAVSGTPAAVAGWGAMQGGASDVPSILRTAPTTLLPDVACARTYGAFDAATMICAADVGSLLSATCHGDSGGPLAVARPDGSWLQVGIVSWGTDDCDARLPQVFARVGALSDWIGGALAGVAAPPPAPNPPPVLAGGGSSSAKSAAAIGGGASASGGSTSARTTGPRRYRGTTRQGEPIALRVAGHGALRGFAASYRIRCGGRWRSGQLRAAALGARATARERFDVTRRGASRVRYRVTGAFAGRRLTGTVRVDAHGRGGGRCTTGVVPFAARRVR